MECGYVGILTVDLHLPGAGSLKAKRKELLRVRNGLARRFSCAVAEVDHHDLWQRAGLTLAVVALRPLLPIDETRYLSVAWEMRRDGDWLVVSTVSLELADGRLSLAAPRPERIRAWWDGASFLDSAEPGDMISLHWDWACERLDPVRLRSLIVWTRRELEIANRSI